MSPSTSAASPLLASPPSRATRGRVCESPQPHAGIAITFLTVVVVTLTLLIRLLTHKGDETHAEAGLRRPRDEAASDLRWGIAGLGLIANDFAAVLAKEGSTLNAVAANYLAYPKERAQIFAGKFNVPRYYGSYVELAEDDSVDIIYIANTNAMHFNTSILMLSKGKHVLVEKPTTLSREDTRWLVEYAKNNVEISYHLLVF